MTLMNGDCLELIKQIPSNSVDLILIDPPYEISRPTNFQSGEETGRDTDRFRISMVLDCFMGSGTTGVACKNTNREFIGIELDEKYYKVACERLGA